MASVPIDTSEATVTPVFKYIDKENVPQSEQKGHEVRHSLAVVEIHTAGSRNALPVFRATDVWKREGNRVITYAERWPEQYQAFISGASQKASGTPLEVLRQHGVSPELQSICRAHKIYSVEALNHLSVDGIRALGIHANKLRDAARLYMASTTSTVAMMDEMASMRAELEALRAAAPTGEPAIDEPPVATEEAEMTDEEIKVAIKAITGSRPAGNPSRDTLLRSLSELQAA